MLADSLASVNDLPLQILVIPPSYIWSTYEELMPRLPSDWGDVPTTTITEGCQWMAIGLDPNQQTARITIQSKSPAAAQTLNAALPQLLKVAINKTKALSFNPILEELTRKPAQVNQDRIVLNMSSEPDFKITAGSLASMLSAIVDPMQAREKQRKFRELALAIHNYESANKVFPPNEAARQPDGQSNLSWRVHILPYIGQKELYLQFHLKEAWDSEHNKKLIEKMPDVFANPISALPPGNVPAGYTTFLAPVGQDTIFGGNKPVRMVNVTDGLSNTIMLVEVKPERAVPWTRPIDYEFLPADPAAELAIGSDGQFQCVLADASVLTLPRNLPKETLKHLFQMNDGQVIQLPQ